MAILSIPVQMGKQAPGATMRDEIIMARPILPMRDLSTEQIAGILSNSDRTTWRCFVVGCEGRLVRDKKHPEVDVFQLACDGEPMHIYRKETLWYLVPVVERMVPDGISVEQLDEIWERPTMPTTLDDLDLSDAQRATLLHIASFDPVGRFFRSTTAYRLDKSLHGSTLKALRDRNLIDDENNLTRGARKIIFQTSGL